MKHIVKSKNIKGLEESEEQWSYDCPADEFVTIPNLVKFEGELGNQEKKSKLLLSQIDEFRLRENCIQCSNTTHDPLVSRPARIVWDVWDTRLDGDRNKDKRTGNLPRPVGGRNNAGTDNTTHMPILPHIIFSNNQEADENRDRPVGAEDEVVLPGQGLKSMARPRGARGHRKKAKNPD